MTYLVTLITQFANNAITVAITVLLRERIHAQLAIKFLKIIEQSIKYKINAIVIQDGTMILYIYFANNAT